MPFLDTQRFDRLSEEEVLDRIGALLAIAIGRREQQRQLVAQAGAMRAAPADDPNLAAVDLTQLVTDPLEARIIMHLRATGRANAREVATSLGVTTSVAAQKLARLCAAGLCLVEDRSRPACYRLRTEYTSN
ncbi:MAG: hypothetical protein ACOZE5_14405 [Verrucomicrobiota bacterium]